MCEGEDLVEFAGGDRVVRKVEEAELPTGMVQGLGCCEARFGRGRGVQEGGNVDDGEGVHIQEQGCLMAIRIDLRRTDVHDQIKEYSG